MKGLLTQDTNAWDAPTTPNVTSTMVINIIFITIIALYAATDLLQQAASGGMGCG